MTDIYSKPDRVNEVGDSFTFELPFYSIEFGQAESFTMNSPDPAYRNQQYRVVFARQRIMYFNKFGRPHQFENDFKKWLINGTDPAAQKETVAPALKWQLPMRNLRDGFVQSAVRRGDGLYDVVFENGICGIFLENGYNHGMQRDEQQRLIEGDAALMQGYLILARDGANSIIGHLVGTLEALNVAQQNLPRDVLTIDLAKVPLTALIRRPARIQGFMNIYQPDGIGHQPYGTTIFATKELAQYGRSKGCIGVIELDLEEGTGLSDYAP